MCLLLSIYLQKSASIQPRTSLSKCGGKFNLLLIRHLSPEAPAPKRSKKTDKNALGSGSPEPVSPDSSSGKNFEEKKNVTIKNTTKKKQEEEEKKKFAVIGFPVLSALHTWSHQR